MDIPNKDGRKTLLRQRLFHLIRRGDERGAERVREELRREASFGGFQPERGVAKDL